MTVSNLELHREQYSGDALTVGWLCGVVPATLVPGPTGPDVVVGAASSPCS